jgi:hypothetical protein
MQTHCPAIDFPENSFEPRIAREPHGNRRERPDCTLLAIVVGTLLKQG